MCTIPSKAASIAGRGLGGCLVPRHCHYQNCQWTVVPSTCSLSKMAVRELPTLFQNNFSIHELYAKCHCCCYLQPFCSGGDFSGKVPRIALDSFRATMVFENGAFVNVITLIIIVVTQAIESCSGGWRIFHSHKQHGNLDPR